MIENVRVDRYAATVFRGRAAQQGTGLSENEEVVAQFGSYVAIVGCSEMYAQLDRKSGYWWVSSTDGKCIRGGMTCEGALNYLVIYLADFPAGMTTSRDCAILMAETAAKLHNQLQVTIQEHQNEN